MRKAWVLVGLVACGGGGSDAPVDAPIDAAPLCTHIQNLRVYRGRANNFGNIGGRFDGTITVEGHPELGSTMTDLEGKFQICLPSMGDSVLRFTRTGSETTLHLIGPNASGAILDVYGAPDTAFAMEKMWEPAGGTSPADATHGNLAIDVGLIDALQAYKGIEGATVSLLPANGLVTRYVSETGTDPTLNATTAVGLAVIGNVPVGEYDIQVNAPGFTSCQQIHGGYKSPDNSQSARLTITGGVATVIDMKCTP